MQQLIGNVRTMFLFRGIAAILFGILTFVWPNLTLSVLVLLFGVFAVVSGITAVAAAVRNREEQGWGLLLFEGILGILAGVVALVWPNITALAFLYLLAAWAIITGIMELVAPLAFPMRGDGAGRFGLDRLRYSDRGPTFVRAARRGLVDRGLRDCVWRHVHRGVLRITLPVS